MTKLRVLVDVEELASKHLRILDGMDQSGVQNQQMINAFQAQQMSNFQHAEMLRRELTNIQNQIQMTQMSAPGSLELRDLSMKETHLRQEMMRRGLIEQ